MMSAKPIKKCPECGKMKLKRLMGTGAGIIFKGPGFYETDYRSESYNKGKEASKAAESNKDTTSKAKKKETKTKPKEKVKTAS